MRILVTGASGHLGYKLSTHLVAAGHQVMGLDLQSRSDGPFPVIAADLSRHSETWTAAFAGQDAIIHLAADRAPEAEWTSVIPNNIDAVPAGLRDSKLLSENQREALIDPVEDWVRASAVGYSSAEEIDTNGIVNALAVAASRAITELLQDADLRVQIVTDGATILLDGSHNWLQQHSGGLPVLVRTKADRDCAVVAAASVVAISR